MDTNIGDRKNVDRRLKIPPNSTPPEQNSILTAFAKQSASTETATINANAKINVKVKQPDHQSNLGKVDQKQNNPQDHVIKIRTKSFDNYISGKNDGGEENDIDEENYIAKE